MKAVDRVSFNLQEGETLALVGESGSGKTSTAIAITRTLPRNVDRYQGKVYLKGENIMEYDDETFRVKIRWRQISVVFQGAMNVLNPTAKVGKQVAEPLRVHLKVAAEEAIAEAKRALKSVGLPEYVAERYPHELSGGMKQRVVIATALIMKPSMVILDEPTSALDIMTQANIINELKHLRSEEKVSYLFITHDLALASELADQVGIMYAGKLAEIGSSEKVYRDPRHPYTQLLLSSVPKLRSDERPQTIQGVPPDLTSLPDGCHFSPRCPFVFEKCQEEPPLSGTDRLSACWLPSAQENEL